jgi:hypothetical protein
MAPIIAHNTCVCTGKYVHPLHEISTVFLRRKATPGLIIELLRHENI